MYFYTPEECSNWLVRLGRIKPDHQKGLESALFHYPKEAHGIFATASWFARSFMLGKPVLLWITEWGIWPSSENWPLYYKLRRGAGDKRQLHEAPGHLFLADEADDLASFAQVVMTNGWGGYILPEADRVNAYFSHDECIEFFAASPEMKEVCEFWAAWGAPVHFRNV